MLLHHRTNLLLLARCVQKGVDHRPALPGQSLTTITFLSPDTISLLSLCDDHWIIAQLAGSLSLYHYYHWLVMTRSLSYHTIVIRATEHRASRPLCQGSASQLSLVQDLILQTVHMYTCTGVHVYRCTMTMYKGSASHLSLSLPWSLSCRLSRTFVQVYTCKHVQVYYDNAQTYLYTAL